MVSFNWEDPGFMDKLMQEYSRFEPYLKKALTQFLADHGHQIVHNRWYQVGIVFGWNSSCLFSRGVKELCRLYQASIA